MTWKMLCVEELQILGISLQSGGLWLKVLFITILTNDEYFLDSQQRNVFFTVFAAFSNWGWPPTSSFGLSSVQVADDSEDRVEAGSVSVWFESSDTISFVRVQFETSCILI